MNVTLSPNTWTLLGSGPLVAQGDYEIFVVADAQAPAADAPRDHGLRYVAANGEAHELRLSGSIWARSVMEQTVYVEPLVAGGSSGGGELTDALASALYALATSPPFGGGGDPMPVTGPLTDAQLRAAPVVVAGAVTISDGAGPVTVDGAVSITGAVNTGGLTDAQLRGAPVDTEPAYAPSGRTPVTGSFTAAGQASAAFAPIAGRAFNITRNGSGVASVRLERSFDGAMWHPLTANGAALMTLTGSFSEQWSDDEAGVQYRLFCTAFTSGPVTYRISQ